MHNLNELKRVSLLMSGSELMSGDTIDSNSATIAQLLLGIGVEVNEIVTVGDQREELAAQILRLTAQSNLLIINGGLGPTQDDLTADVLAFAANTSIQTHVKAKAHILAWCEKKGIKANAANLKQAELPANCEIFPDAPGSAPAFFLSINDCLVIATPGVPSELKIIMEKDIKQYIQTHFSLTPVSIWHKAMLLGIGESRLQQLIDENLAGINAVFDIGFRVAFPLLELKYKAHQHTSVEQQAYWQQALLALVDDYFVGFSPLNLGKQVIELLQEKRLQLACAESCTGGLIASEITKIPGASSVFPGSVVCYANTIKERVLKVPHQTLLQHGAVSKETVVFMFNGILDLMQSDYAIAISGIAGPDGGTPEKPVGTVWIAYGTRESNNTCCLRIPMERQLFQTMATAICLDLTRRHLSGATALPAYLSRWKI